MKESSSICHLNTVRTRKIRWVGLLCSSRLSVRFGHKRSLTNNGHGFSMIPAGINFVIHSGLFHFEKLCLEYNIARSFANRTNFQICEGNERCLFPSTVELPIMKWQPKMSSLARWLIKGGGPLWEFRWLFGSEFCLIRIWLLQRLTSWPMQCFINVKSQFWGK